MQRRMTHRNDDEELEVFRQDSQPTEEEDKSLVSLHVCVWCVYVCVYVCVHILHKDELVCVYLCVIISLSCAYVMAHSSCS